MIYNISQMVEQTQFQVNSNMSKPINKNSTDINPNEYIEEPWDIIGAYFKGKHLEQLVKHQIESFNLFVSQQIPQTIDMFNPVLVRSEQDFVYYIRKFQVI